MSLLSEQRKILESKFKKKIKMYRLREKNKSPCMLLGGDREAGIRFHSCF